MSQAYTEFKDNIFPWKREQKVKFPGRKIPGPQTLVIINNINSKICFLSKLIGTKSQF